ncbi:hypothetical protein V2J09_012799 [Rumex salicifolius]
MELDDWDLSAEELDSLEKDALRQISQRNSSSTSYTSTSNYNSASSDFQRNTNYPKQPQRLPQQKQAQTQPVDSFPRSDFDLSPIKPSDAGRHRSTQVDPCSLQSKVLPSSVVPKIKDDNAKEPPILHVKILLHASGNLAAKFPFDQMLVSAVRKIPKASWHTKERLWMFPVSSLPFAEKILSEIPSTTIEIEKLDPLVQRAVAAASKASDLQDRYNRIPAYVESKLMPFQKDGVRFVLQHGGRALLADEMGLGKTLQAIAVTACVSDSWPVLVLTPSSLRLHWASMINQWLNIPPSDIVVVLPQWGGSNKCGYRVVGASNGNVQLDGIFNIVSYDSVTKLQNTLLTSDFKVVVADESHYLKNAQAKRTSASLPVIQLEALCPDVYKNVHEYGNRYCKGGAFGVYQGASNHEELHNLMKATVMIRRLKKDVLSQLPVKRRQQVFLDLAEKDMRQINALFLELEVLKAKIKTCKSKDEHETLKLTEKSLINKIYNESAEAKIPAVLDYLGTLVEAGCKFLIFAHHQSMIESMHQFLLKKKVRCIRIDGSTPPVSRQSLVVDFQEQESIKAAVLSIKAAGVGLTLTAASTVIFAELSWTPGDLIQAEDRAHRIGQVSSVNVYYLLANGTGCGPKQIGKLRTDSKPSISSSPAKQTTLDSFVKPSISNSPGKQLTMDSFVKRCNSSSDSDSQPKAKLFKH